MKNVEHMTKAESNQQPSSSPEAGWSEESVPLKDLIQHGPLQVRHKLDKAAVKRYPHRHGAMDSVGRAQDPD